MSVSAEGSGFAPTGMVGRGHTDTAVEAALGVGPKLQGWRDKLLKEFLKAGYHGLTAAEAGRKVGLSTQIAGARFLELRGERRKGNEVPVPLIMRTVHQRALPGGRKGVVHILTPAGWKAAMHLGE